MEAAVGRKTSSRFVTETVRGSHVFEISGYSLQRGLGARHCIPSAVFAVGGVQWRILFYPNGVTEGYDDYVGVLLCMVSQNAKVRASCHLSMLDMTGSSVPYTVTWNQPREFDSSGRASKLCGDPKFKKRSELEASPYLRDDRIIIECVINVVKESPAAKAKPFAETQVPPSDITEHLRKLLEEKEGADVTFEVEGEAFPAHKTVLAMRSPVFKAELYGAMREKDMSHITIGDIHPAVFGALLHFIYTDSLPAMDNLDRDDYREIIKHLLVAADRYAMERMQLMCESILCKSLDVETVATTLALADQHHCSVLKDACIEFILSPNRRDDVVASKGYAHLKRSCPSVIVDVFERATKSRKI